MILNTPLIVKNTMLRNRIVMPPMATGKSENGKPTEELISYYRARAKAAGLIIVEHEYVSDEGMAHPGQLSMADDSVIPVYRELVKNVHAEGAAVIPQINHAGLQAKGSGLQAIAPGAAAAGAFGNNDAAAEMSGADIERVKECFAAAAVRAKEAGFDGVEVHAAHGYLLNQFYSPLANTRNDEYGAGSLENRTRMMCEIIGRIRGAVGGEFMIAIRFGACDYMDGGSTLDEIPDAAMMLKDAGVDLIDVSGGMCGPNIPGRTAAGWFADASKPVREKTGLPVILTGGIKTGAEAEQLLAEGSADLIGVGRPMLKDADWAVKALAMEL